MSLGSSGHHAKSDHTNIVNTVGEISRSPEGVLTLKKEADVYIHTHTFAEIYVCWSILLSLQGRALTSDVIHFKAEIHYSHQACSSIKDSNPTLELLILLLHSEQQYLL